MTTPRVAAIVVLCGLFVACRPKPVVVITPAWAGWAVEHARPGCECPDMLPLPPEPQP